MSKIDEWDSQIIGLFVLIALFTFVIICFYGIGCNTNKQTTIEVLKAQGYSDIHITGNNILACGQGDATSNTFTAKTLNGTKLRGIVCCGILKGCTVRTLGVD